MWTLLSLKKMINIQIRTSLKNLYAALWTIVVAELVIVSLLSIADLSILFVYEPKSFRTVMNSLGLANNITMATA